jgi:hypothetical protein
VDESHDYIIEQGEKTGLADVTALESVSFVMMDGRVVRPSAEEPR